MGALLEFSTALGYCLGQAPYSGIPPACGPYVPHFWQLLDTKAGRFMNKVLSRNREFYGPVHQAYNRSIWYWMVYGICTPICHERWKQIGVHGKLVYIQ